MPSLFHLFSDSLVQYIYFFGMRELITRKARMQTSMCYAYNMCDVCEIRQKYKQRIFSSLRRKHKQWQTSSGLGKELFVMSYVEFQRRSKTCANLACV